LRIPTDFEKLWDASIQEETRLEIVIASVDEVQDLAIIKKMRKDGKKRGPRRGKEEETCSSNHGKKD
jgi:hypothetical protein